LRSEVKSINTVERFAFFRRVKLRFINDQCVSKIGLFLFIAGLNRFCLLLVASPGCQDWQVALSDGSNHLVARSGRQAPGHLLFLRLPLLRISQSRVDSSANLKDLGIDSIMAAELQVATEERTGIGLRTLFLTRGPSLNEMTDTIIEAILTGQQPLRVLAPRGQRAPDL
jgi:acyl carrier protein